MSARLAYHATHPGWRRLLTAVVANEHAPGDPEALMGNDPGLDDLDPDVLAELLPARARLNGDDQ